MDTYTSDMCPEADFRHSKGMSDFQSSFFAKLKAPLFGVGTIAFVFSPAIMLARRGNRMMAENTDHGIVEKSVAGFAAEEYNDSDHHIITTTSNNLSAELVSSFSDPSSSSLYSTVAATFACVFAFVAWSARSYFFRTSGKKVAMPTAPQLFDMFLDLVLRPAVGVAGIITVMRTITRLATAQGILATVTLPAVTMAHILCAAAWALATWSALIYMFIGAKKDNETQRLANKASAPPVVCNIIEGEEVDLDVISTANPATTTCTVDTTALSSDVAAAAGSAAAVHLDGLSSDDKEDIDAEEEGITSDEDDEVDEDDEGDEGEDITSDEDDEVDEDDEGDEGEEGAAEDVDAAVLAKIVRRRERGIRIGAAISKILNGTSAGVLGRRHLLRQPRRGGDGDGIGADAENETTPTTTATATTKKASKFRRVMSDILNISNAGFIAHFTSSADEDEDDCDGDGDDSAFGASSSSAGGDVEAKAVGRFSKMLNACREASASGLSAAKRRYSRRSVS